MNEDDNSDAWANQLELEHRMWIECEAERLWKETLNADPEYIEWLEKIANENLNWRMNHETTCEVIEQF